MSSRPKIRINIHNPAWLRLGIGVLVSLITLYLAFKDINIQQVSQALVGANLRFILLALMSWLANNLGKALRWHVLLGPERRKAPPWNVFTSLLVGQMLNFYFPARLGELTRAYAIGSLGLGRVFVFGTIVVEKVIDMIAYAFLFLILLLLLPLPAWVGESAYTFAGISVLLSVAVVVAAFKREPLLQLLDRLAGLLPARLRDYLLPRLRAGLSSLDVLHSRWDIFQLAGWTALVWGTALLNNQLILLALDIHLPWTASLLLLIALQAGISIPSVPGRIGIFEYICILSLSAFGLDRATSLSYGIVLHAIVLLPTTLLGLVFMLFTGSGRQRALAKREG